MLHTLVKENVPLYFLDSPIFFSFLNIFLFLYIYSFPPYDLFSSIISCFLYIYFFYIFFFPLFFMHSSIFSSFLYISERAQKTLNQIGPAVWHGAFSTFLGFSILGLAKSFSGYLFFIVSIVIVPRF